MRCVAHPWFDLLTMLARDHRLPDATQAYAQMLERYLALWTDYAPMARLRQAWELARPLAALHQAVSYQHIVAGLEAPPNVNWPGVCLSGCDRSWSAAREGRMPGSIAHTWHVPSLCCAGYRVNRQAVYPASSVLAYSWHAPGGRSILQAADAGKHPILLRVEADAEPGLGKPTGKVYRGAKRYLCISFCGVRDDVAGCCRFVTLLPAERESEQSQSEAQ